MYLKEKEKNKLKRFVSCIKQVANRFVNDYLIVILYGLSSNSMKFLSNILCKIISYQNLQVLGRLFPYFLQKLFSLLSLYRQ